MAKALLEVRRLALLLRRARQDCVATRTLTEVRKVGDGVEVEDAINGLVVLTIEGHVCLWMLHHWSLFYLRGFWQILARQDEMHMSHQSLAMMHLVVAKAFDAGHGGGCVLTDMEVQLPTYADGSTPTS